MPSVMYAYVAFMLFVGAVLIYIMIGVKTQQDMSLKGFLIFLLHILSFGMMGG